MSSKPITKKEYSAMSRKVEKMKYRLSEYKKRNKITSEKINNNVTDKIDSKIKLDTMNSLIGYLVRKGNKTGIEIEILVEIANDYEESLKKK